MHRFDGARGRGAPSRSGVIDRREHFSIVGSFRKVVEEGAAGQEARDAHTTCALAVSASGANAGTGKAPTANRELSRGVIAVNPAKRPEDIDGRREQTFAGRMREGRGKPVAGDAVDEVGPNSR